MNLKKKKRIITWLDQYLPEPYRTSAINYSTYYNTIDKLVDCPEEALKRGFIWSTTKEFEQNPKCWSLIHYKLMKNEPIIVEEIEKNNIKNKK